MRAPWRKALPLRALTLVVGLLAGASVQAADLKLGLTVSLTGGTDDYGLGAKRGFELALKEYNEKGGYRGRKVEGIIYDDETKPAKGVENLVRLITRDKVFAVVGPVNSGVALAMIDIAQRMEMPLMDTIATAVPITQKYKGKKNYIFRVSLSDGIQTSFMIDYLKKHGYRRIGLMHDSTGWGQSGRDEALRQLRAAGIPLVAGPEVFDQNDTDMTVQLSKMEEARVDFIIAYALAPAGVQILKSMQKIGYKVPIASTWAWSAPNFLKLGGKELIEGTLFVTSYIPDHSENAKRFHRKVVQEYGEDFFPVATAQTYDGTRLVLKALDLVGPDPRKIRDALEMIDDFTGAVTNAKPKPFSKEDHEALGPGTGFLAQWRNGRPVKAQ